MANKKKKEEEVATPETGVATDNPTDRGAVDEGQQPAEPAVTEITVKFRDHEGKPTERTFSQEVHGDDFAKLAEEFKTTNAAKLITE